LFRGVKSFNRCAVRMVRDSSSSTVSQLSNSMVRRLLQPDQAAVAGAELPWRQHDLGRSTKGGPRIVAFFNLPLAFPAILAQDSAQ
jgi:hypothetical protein